MMMRSEQLGLELCTYVSVVVQLVVGEFEFVKRDDLLGPLRSFGWRVGVNVNPRRRVGIRFASYHPARTVLIIRII